MATHDIINIFMVTGRSHPIVFVHVRGPAPILFIYSHDSNVVRSFSCHSVSVL